METVTVSDDLKISSEKFVQADVAPAPPIEDAIQSINMEAKLSVNINRHIS